MCSVNFCYEDSDRAVRYAVGIDSGTTNSVIVQVDPDAVKLRAQIMSISHLVDRATVEARNALPSFICRGNQERTVLSVNSLEGSQHTILILLLVLPGAGCAKAKLIGRSHILPWQWVSLWHACRAAKEQLLSADTPESQTNSILSRGAKLIEGMVSMELDCSAVADLLIDEFFPEYAITDPPQRPENQDY